MAREIKFRFWNEATHEMFEDTTGYEILRGINDTISRMQKHGLIPMEYIGINDKNGKEIYEGDILKYEWQENPIVVHDIRSINKTGINYSEIIGNIYENP